MPPHAVLVPLCQKGLTQVSRTEAHGEKWVFRPANNVLPRKCRKILCIYAAGTVLILAKRQHFLKARTLGNSHVYFLDFLVEFQTVMGHSNILRGLFKLGL